MSNGIKTFLGVLFLLIIGCPLLSRLFYSFNLDAQGIMTATFLGIGIIVLTVDMLVLNSRE